MKTRTTDRLEIVCRVARRVVSELADYENMTTNAAAAMRSLRAALLAYDGLPIYPQETE